MTLALRQCNGAQSGGTAMGSILDDRLRRLVSQANAGSYVPPPDPTGSEGRRIMATKVKLGKGKEFEFRQAKGGALSAKYPWDEWLGGDLLLLERSDVNGDGELVPGGTKRDFEVDRDAMPGKLKFAARRRYKIVQISKRDADGQKIQHEGLIIKGREMTGDERYAEDVLRAEEKEENKTRRAKARAETAAPVPA